MKRNKCILFSALLAIAATMFTLIQLQDASYFNQQYTSVSIRFKTVGVDQSFLKTSLANEKSRGQKKIPQITAWSQLCYKKIKNLDLDRSVSVRINIVNGDSSLTAPMSLRYGNYTYQGDQKGCVIDCDSAFQLYGTENAVGNELVYHGIAYYIRGVVKTNGHLLLLQANDANLKYKNLELVYHNSEMAEKLTEEFLVQNGFPQNYVLVDGCIYGRMLNEIMILPVWLLFSIVGIWMMICLWEKKKELKRKTFFLYQVIGILLFAGYGTILYRCIGNPFYIPQKLIPTKFSDFNYWLQQYYQMRGQLVKLRYLTPNLKDVYFENAILKVPLNLLITIILYLAFLLQSKLLFDGRKLEKNRGYDVTTQTIRNS